MNAPTNLSPRWLKAVLLLAASLALILTIYFSASSGEKDLPKRVEHSARDLGASIVLQIEGTKIRTQSSYPEETLSALCKDLLRGNKSLFQDKYRMDPERISLSYHPPNLAEATINKLKPSGQRSDFRLDLSYDGVTAVVLYFEKFAYP